MKNQKLSLEAIQVNSFVTGRRQIKGGIARQVQKLSVVVQSDTCLCAPTFWETCERYA